MVNYFFNNNIDACVHIMANLKDYFKPGTKNAKESVL